MVSSQKKDLFKIDGISKIYNGRYVFNNVSFSIKLGEIFGVIGKSGCGKTTLLNMLIADTKPDKGKILFRDTKLVDSVDDSTALRSVFKEKSDLKKMYGFASQSPSFYPNLTVMENLIYFGSLYGISKKVLLANAESLLELVELHASKNILAKEMSGGMQRRLDIACALIHGPSVLILDEPTSDLDPILSNAIWEILRKVNAKGTTIIIVSHNIFELEYLCHRFVVLSEGKVTALGTAKQIKEKACFEEQIYLHSEPGKYTALLNSLSLDIRSKTKGTNLKGKLLMIKTLDAPNVLMAIMETLKKSREKIVEIELSKPSLDTVFVDLQKNEKGKITAVAKENDSNVKIAQKKKKVDRKKAKRAAKSKKKRKKNNKKSKSVVEEEEEEAKVQVEEVKIENEGEEQ